MRLPYCELSDDFWCSLHFGGNLEKKPHKNKQTNKQNKTNTFKKKFNEVAPAVI